MQNHYSLIYREEEREMFPTLKVSFRFAVASNLNRSRCLELARFRGRHSRAASWLAL